MTPSTFKTLCSKLPKSPSGLPKPFDYTQCSESTNHLISELEHLQSLDPPSIHNYDPATYTPTYSSKPQSLKSIYNKISNCLTQEPMLHSLLQSKYMLNNTTAGRWIVEYKKFLVLLITQLYALSFYKYIEILMELQRCTRHQ